MKKRHANECNCNSNTPMAIMKTYKNIYVFLKAKEALIISGMLGAYVTSDVSHSLFHRLFLSSVSMIIRSQLIIRCRSIFLTISITSVMFFSVQSALTLEA